MSRRPFLFATGFGVLAVFVFVAFPREGERQVPAAAARAPKAEYVIVRPDAAPASVVLNPEDAAAYAENAPEGTILEPEREFRMAAVPNDPRYGEQTELARIGAESAWSTERGSTDVVVAVLDSGVDLDHPDLSGNIWTNEDETPGNGADDDGNGFIDDRYGWDFVAENNDPSAKLDSTYVSGDDDGVHHGTLVSGVIGAYGNNSKGIAGVNWRVSIMPLRVLNSAGIGKTSDILQAIDYARENGADVVNMSLVGNDYSSALDAGIQEAAASGVLIVAAAGNGGIDLNATKRYPVCMDSVIGVASVSSADARSSFSNYGADCVDISAPGQGILTTQAVLDAPGFDEAYGSGWSGTSLATPFVAGAAGLVKAARPLLRGIDTFSVLADHAVSLGNSSLGSGRLDLAELFALPPASGSRARIITAPGPGGGPDVRILSPEGHKHKSILAYAPTFGGGVNVAAGDVSSGDKEEVVTGAMAGGGPHVRVFDKAGAVRGQFFAYAEGFRGGVDVAAGDTNNDGTDEIITAPGPGGGPDVRIFSADGHKHKSIGAYDPNGRWGLHVAAGDVNGDGMAEIVTVEQAGASPLVRTFQRSGNLLAEFFAYDRAFRGGVDVAVADLSGDGTAEIITAPGPGGGPLVRIFTMIGEPVGQFFAYDPGFRGGVRVGAGDVDGDGDEDIITGAGAGGGPQVRFFTKRGEPIGQFFAYDPGFRGGVDVVGGIIF